MKNLSYILKLSRCACSQRAASLRLGLFSGPLRGPALGLPAVHPRCSQRLRASHLSRCETARTFPRFRCASSKTQPRCAGPGFCFPSAPSSLTVRFSALLICHAAPVRNARLPSASACSPARCAGLRSASLRSTRAAHNGCALLICHAAKRPGRSLAFAAPQAKPSPAARAPAFAFPPLQAPSLSVSPRFFLRTALRTARRSQR